METDIETTQLDRRCLVLCYAMFGPLKFHVFLYLHVF